MTWEMLPTDKLKDPRIWAALLEKMPVHAMLRNLGRMTSIGTLKVFGEANKFVTDKLADETVLQDDRLHPAPRPYRTVAVSSRRRCPRQSVMGNCNQIL